MFSWQRLVGVVIGLLGGGALLALKGGPERRLPPSGAVLSECDGRLQTLVVQYASGARELVMPVYRDFLAGLGSGAQVFVVCPDGNAFDEFVAAAGKVECRLSPIVTGHAVTAWARDRWVALGPAKPGAATTLWSPRGEAGGEVWPARAGDERVGRDIAAALGASVVARRSGLYFDGGDFLADEENVFVMPRVLPRNVQQTVRSRQELVAALARELKRRVILLDEAPDHHAGMFMASVGGRTMLVGDPALGRKLVSIEMAEHEHSGRGQFMGLPGGPDFRAETQRRFDAVARQCAAAGYRVVRIPVVPARDGRTYLTYVNVLMEQRGAGRRVYLPTYQGVARLNDAARQVWEGLGYEVRSVDCTSVYGHFGCLHCLVNVLERG